jgi:hypothetical protein
MIQSLEVDIGLYLFLWVWADCICQKIHLFYQNHQVCGIELFTIIVYCSFNITWILGDVLSISDICNLCRLFS